MFLMNLTMYLAAGAFFETTEAIKMKFGMRTPSIKKSIKARTTGKGQASCSESFNSRVRKKGAGNRECSSIPILMLYFWDHYSRLLEA